MVLGGLTTGALLFLAGIVGLIAVFMNAKKKDMWKAIAGIGLIGGFLIGGSAAISELTSKVGFQAAAPSVSGAAVAAQQPLAVSGAQCSKQTDGTNTLNVVYRNVENSSLSYLAAAVAAESSDGVSQASGTATGGNTLSYLALNVPPCMSGKIYGIQSTAQASAVEDFSSFDLTSNYEMRGTAASVINLLARDSTYTAKSNGNNSGYVGETHAESGNGATDGAAFYQNTTLGAGGSISFYLDYAVNGTAAAYGAYVNGQPASDGVVFAFDSVDASIFSPNALTLVSDTAGVTLNKVQCPSDIAANRNSEACWMAKSLRVSDGNPIRLRGTLKADLNDPTVTGDNPVLYIDDRQFYRDTDGKVKYGSFTAGGTNVGLGGVSLTFVVN